MQTQVHTIYLTVGPTNCGKTTLIKNYLIPQLKSTSLNIQYISSDNIRRELLGHNYDKYNPQMLEVSVQTFDILYQKIKLVTNYPINAEFVFVDTTGLTEKFRDRIREIAIENHYHIE